MRVLIIDSDQAVVSLLSAELGLAGCMVDVAISADMAIKLSDKNSPDVVITELTLPSNSGTEFIYEFRTYRDWKTIPIIVFSSLLLDREVLESQDWKLLNIHSYFYKPKSTLNNVIDTAVDA